MRNLGFLAKRACAFGSLSILAACGARADGATPLDLPVETTMGADLPPDDTSTSGEEINPQRHPESWRKPSSIFDEPASEPTTPKEPPATPETPATPATPPVVLPSVPTPATRPVPFRGVNLAGAEFGSALPGAYGTDYTFPTNAEVDYYVGKSMNTFRIGFKWERMQRAQYDAFDATYLARLQSIVSYATSKGAFVILNPHNFARYYGVTVGSPSVPNAAFSDFWERLATTFKSNAKVMFNLVNEPHDMPTEQWVSAANAAIAAIRSTAAKNVIIVPGNAWTGAHSWYGGGYGTPNSTAMLDVVDPGNNVVFEVHQYMDADSSGSSGTCVSTTIGRERLTGFVKWLRDNNKKGFLGELAGGDNATCNVAVKNMLDYVHANADVFVGWTWWAGGPWWGNYKFALDPAAGSDRPQMALLTPFLQK